MASSTDLKSLEAEPPFILALDVGTSSVRALLFDATGAAIPHIRAQHSYKLITSNEGEVSVDADMLVETVAKSVDETLAAAGPLAAQIGAVATANVGSGCVHPDRWALTIGTSSAMRVIISPEQAIPPYGLWLYLLDAQRAVLGGALSEGGNLLAWLADTLRLPSLAEAESLIVSSPPDGHGLTILPFPSGERSLGWHAEARMTIDGISIHTSPADLLCAGLEALAYQLAAVYERLIETLHIDDPKPKVIGNGGTLLSSPVLQHILADVLNTPLYPSREREASAHGAALLALESLGVLPDIARVEPDLEAPVLPDKQRTAIYQRAAVRQQQLYSKLNP